jgi:hypothetical protein
VAARSEAWVRGLSLAGNAGSNPVGVWMSVSCERYELAGSGFCDGPISRPEESEVDREAPIMRRPWPNTGCCAFGAGWWVGIKHLAGPDGRAV